MKKKVVVTLEEDDIKEVISDWLYNNHDTTYVDRSDIDLECQITEEGYKFIATAEWTEEE